MRRVGLVLCAMSLWLSGCLPGDERPEPGSLLVNVRRSAPAADGFTTDDGWAISFERFVAGVGSQRLGGNDCVDYSFSTYDRLYDFTKADTSKLALHYGLGPCYVGFSLSPPSPTAILMAGVTEADRDFMGLELDGFNSIDDAEDLEELGPSLDQVPIALLVKGSATRAGVTKSFDWLIRRFHSTNKCFAPNDDETLINVFELQAGDALVKHLEVRPQELFRYAPTNDAPIVFQPYADADLDGDGAITFPELEGTEIPQEIIDELVEDWPVSIPPELLPDATLRALMHDILSSRVLVFEGASECDTGLAFDAF